MVASFREFQLRHGLPAISQCLEDELIETKDYVTFIRLIGEAFPFTVMIQNIFFSNKKSLFERDLSDPVMVKKGLHPFRRWVAQLAHEKRADFSFPHVEEYTTQGFVKLIFPITIDSEFNNIPYSVNKQPFNLIKTIEAPKLQKLHDTIKQYIIPCVSKTSNNDIDFKYDWNTFLQRVDNRPDDNDNQKLYHVDTFFPAIKWWWFPQEVKAEKGAFWYASGSSKVVDSYLDWLYDQTIRIVENRSEPWKGKDHVEGSFRASLEEVQTLGFEPQPMEVQAGTLLIGNVAGFHRRGDTDEPIIRNALHGSIRIENPFKF